MNEDATTTTVNRTVARYWVSLLADIERPTQAQRDLARAMATIRWRMEQDTTAMLEGDVEAADRYAKLSALYLRLHKGLLIGGEKPKQIKAKALPTTLQYAASKRGQAAPTT